MSPLRSSKLMWPHLSELSSMSLTRACLPIKSWTSQLLRCIVSLQSPVSFLTTLNANRHEFSSPKEKKPIEFHLISIHFWWPCTFLAQFRAVTNYLTTESEVVTGKSQTEASPYWPSDSEVNTIGRGLRFTPGPNGRDYEVVYYMAHKNKQKAKASAAEVIALHPIVRTQGRNRPVDITGE